MGRRTINLPADLEVTTKAVRPTAEAIGGDIADSDQKIQRALIVRSDGRDRRTIRILTVMFKRMAPAARREPTVPRRSDPCELLAKSGGGFHT
jgi:hypothetical protein